MSQFTSIASVATSSASGLKLQDGGLVYLPRREYDDLTRTAKHYSLRHGLEQETIVNADIIPENLCQNLLNQDVGEHALFLLSTEEPNEATTHSETQSTAQSWRPNDSSSSSSDNATIPPHGHDYHDHSSTHQSKPFSEGGILTGREAIHLAPFQPESQSTYHQKTLPRWPPRDGPRSILLSNLAEGTTYSNITFVIRGGQLLDIFLRPESKTAAVSFVSEEDAIAFYEYVRRSDLYIKQKRVHVQWQNRQQTMGMYLARKVTQGATRNLVIHECRHDITEQIVRDDLEHIHNLAVVSVDIIGDKCYISTNSIAGATTAKACMMSRLRYKGCRIEYDVDECTQSIERMPPRDPRNRPPGNDTATGPDTNRFAVLQANGSSMPQPNGATFLSS